MAHPCLANIFTVGLAQKGMSVKLREEQDDQALCGAVTRHHSSGAHVHTARASEQLAVLDFVLPQVLGGVSQPGKTCEHKKGAPHLEIFLTHEVTDVTERAEKAGI